MMVPFWILIIIRHLIFRVDPYYNTAPNISGAQKGATILTTTQLGFGASGSGLTESGLTLNAKWEFPKIGDPNIVR